MTPAQSNQLLQFIRHEILPLLLTEAVPGGAAIMVRRLKLEYPELDLFAERVAESDRDDS